MRSFQDLVASLWCLAAFAPLSAAGERQQQELHCVATQPTGAFLVEFSVQADRKKFCVGDVCWPLTRVADFLEYRCPSAKGSTGYCAPYPFSGSKALVSSAGPFVMDERLTINLATGTFEGVASGEQGDIGRRSYLSTASGLCTQGLARKPDAR